ncbi:MAG: T9SS type A sorting domain-containing protein [Paludibacteraceae bacterium]
MKKIILLIVLSFAITLHAQNSIPNSSFEQWTSSTYSYPTYYDFNSNKDEMGIYNINKTVGYTGNYGVELKTVMTNKPQMAYLLNFQPPGQDPNPLIWHGGVPYSLIPTGFKGYYKYNVASGDQGMAIIVFSKNGANIGTYYYNLGGLHSDYTPFNFTFSPVLSQTPDSVIVAFASSDFATRTAGSILVVDNISFTGAASQPTQMNGDFEQWTDVTIENPSNWYNDNQNFQVLKKTTDSYTGQYALELTTYLGEQDGQPAPVSAQAITGYYGNNCNGNCYPLGGFPFSNQSDVLEFYYKYIPSGTDQANVGIYFKKKNSGLDGWYAGANLPAATQYTFMSVPFNLSFVPDSVIIQIQSSFGNGGTTLTMANIGSTLKIDDINFRSVINGSKEVKQTSLSIYPNPAKNYFNIDRTLEITRVTITDLRGAIIYRADNFSGKVDVSNLITGIYLVRLESKNRHRIEKLIIN